MKSTNRNASGSAGRKKTRKEENKFYKVAKNKLCVSFQVEKINVTAL
jgi:hypothetical protein